MLAAFPKGGRKSALDGFAAIQLDLRRAGERLPIDTARDLWQRQLLLAGAYQAAIGDCAGDGARFAEAKRVQIESADGAPLAVCVGRDRDGCGAVFADSMSTRGPMPFRFYCPACRGRSTRRRKSEDRAYAAGLEELAPGVWWGVCRCGAEYVTHDVRRRTCDECHRGHR